MDKVIENIKEQICQKIVFTATNLEEQAQEFEKFSAWAKEGIEGMKRSHLFVEGEIQEIKDFVENTLSERNEHNIVALKDKARAKFIF